MVRNYVSFLFEEDTRKSASDQILRLARDYVLNVFFYLKQ